MLMQRLVHSVLLFRAHNNNQSIKNSKTIGLSALPAGNSQVELCVVFCALLSKGSTSQQSTPNRSTSFRCSGS